MTTQLLRNAKPVCVNHSKVVLATADDPALQSTAPGKALSSVEVAALKGNEGDQDYKLPANTDFARYSTVVIYCERFHAVFGTATLQPF